MLTQSCFDATKQLPERRESGCFIEYQNLLDSRCHFMWKQKRNSACEIKTNTGFSQLCELCPTLNTTHC